MERTFRTRRKAKKDSVVKKCDNRSKKKSTQFPCLEIHIQHCGPNHESKIQSERIFYKYKGKDENIKDIYGMNTQETNKLNQDKEEFCFKDGNKIVSVNSSVINQYRQKNNYYGPLKVIPEHLEENAAYSPSTCLTRLEPLDFSIIRKTDQSVAEVEVDSLMVGASNIIPSCDYIDFEDDFTFFSKKGKRYKVSNDALASYEKRTGLHKKQLELRSVREILRAADDIGESNPVTILNIGPKKTNLNRKRRVTRRNLKKRKSMTNVNKEKVASYLHNYSNWSLRGNVCVNDIQQVGIRFIDEILTENHAKDTVDAIGNTTSLSAKELQLSSAPNIIGIQSSYSYGNKEHFEDIWLYLSNLVRNDDTLINFQYEMPGEKWIEIKRTFNLFCIDGESLSDIILKVVFRKEGSQYTLNYYLRCLGKLRKTGSLTSKTGVCNLLKELSREKYVCVGLDKEKFIYQVDTNEMLRKFVKENVMMSTSPFETIHHKRCIAIVRYKDIENYKFKRGTKVIYGPLVICKQCEDLFDKLEQLINPNIKSNHVTSMVSLSSSNQRYGPIQNLKVSNSIKKLCTETVFEFVSGAQKERENTSSMCNDLEVDPKQRKINTNGELSDDDVPLVTVTEEQFQNMVSLKSYVTNSQQRLDKSCNKCGFQDRSMIALFTHISKHLKSNIDECGTCNKQFGSRDALRDHLRVNHCKELFVCSTCQHTSFSAENFYLHTNSHRPSQPFLCFYCSHRSQTIDDYKQHMKTAHLMETLEDMNFVCGICQTYFYTEDLLFIHQLNNNHIEKTLVKCRICCLTSDTVSTFQAHILNHTYDEREYHNVAICLACKKFFFSSYELDDHTKEMHGDILLKQKEAPNCPEVSRNNLNKNIKTFNCSKCFKIFGNSSALQKHDDTSHREKAIENTVVATPTLEYSLACNLCGMKFTSEYFLNSHMNLHTTNRSVFHSDDIDYMYPKRSQSHDHMMVSGHTKLGEKQQQILQHHSQQQQMSSYPTHFNQQQQLLYADEHVPPVPNESQVIQAPPADPAWNQQTDSIDGTQDSVYSLLHL